MYTYACTRVYTCLCTRLYACLYTCEYTCVCTCPNTCVHISINMSVHMSSHTYMCTCMYKCLQVLNFARAPSTHVSHVSGTLFCEMPSHAKWLSGRILLNKIQQESPGCIIVANRDHEVCLAAEHAKRRGSLRSQELVDANPEGAVLFSSTDYILATAAL